ncbi:MAG: phosphoribosyltransferase [Cyanobacteria bacterium]|jgi:hypoxanthine phosphoribosyltransferase|nr:phosphoribosyltransferase [Cyanobacteriota bacterium]
MRVLSWLEFDQAVQSLAERLSAVSFAGVYGVPRGGLCLAVALSHALEVPLLAEPQPDALIVDDVYETGRTLEALHARFPKAHGVVWVSKRPLQWWDAVVVTDSSEWLLFPWENAAQARDDERSYRTSRGIG